MSYVYRKARHSFQAVQVINGHENVLHTFPVKRPHNRDLRRRAADDAYDAAEAVCAKRRGNGIAAFVREINAPGEAE